MNLVLKHGRFILLIGLLSFAGALNIKAQQKEQTLHDLNKLLVNTVMTDLFTPPLAARIYTYPNIAFYECSTKFKINNWLLLADVHCKQELQAKRHWYRKMKLEVYYCLIDD